MIQQAVYDKISTFDLSCVRSMECIQPIQTKTELHLTTYCVDPKNKM